MKTRTAASFVFTAVLLAIPGTGAGSGGVAAREIATSAARLRSTAEECRDAVRTGELRSCQVEVRFKNGLLLQADEADRLAERYDEVIRRIGGRYGALFHLYRLETAIDDVSRTSCDQRACNFFVQGVAHRLGINLAGRARDMLAEGRAHPRWLGVSAEAAEELAAAGEFVLASARGHVAIVVPSHGRLALSRRMRNATPSLAMPHCALSAAFKNSCAKPKALRRRPPSPKTGASVSSPLPAGAITTGTRPPSAEKPMG